MYDPNQIVATPEALRQGTENRSLLGTLLLISGSLLNQISPLHLARSEMGLGVAAGPRSSSLSAWHLPPLHFPAWELNSLLPCRGSTAQKGPSFPQRAPLSISPARPKTAGVHRGYGYKAKSSRVHSCNGQGTRAAAVLQSLIALVTLSVDARDGRWAHKWLASQYEATLILV